MILGKEVSWNAVLSAKVLKYRVLLMPSMEIGILTGSENEAPSLNGQV